jgi:hypothetical protein
VVTEREIPKALATNVKWLHPFFHSQVLALPEYKLRGCTTLLTQKVTLTDASLVKIAAECDEQLSLLPGSSLAVARHLMATHQWLVDMNQPIEPREKLILLSAELAQSNLLRGEVG